jgi:ParB family chromosome partitioning protein
VYLPTDKLRAFADHPYKIIDNDEMASLVESIKTQGVLTPIVVRPMENGEYEIVSGHRRVFACNKLGIFEVPAVVRELTREEAIVVMADSNLHRDGLLPSEKAFAYKMKLDAIKRQGERTDLTSAQLGQRLTSVEKIAAESDESKSQVQRYISLTRLIPELLKMVDDGRIALTPAVELSKLHWQTQKLIYEICDMDDLTPSYSQTVRMRKLADEGALGEDAIREIMSEEKANQRERIVIYMDDIKQYYPRNMLPKDIVADIKGLLHKRRLEQMRRKENRDAR